MSEKNPTWLDGYYLVVKKRPSEVLRDILCLDELSAEDCRTVVIQLVNAAESMKKQIMPNTQDVRLISHTELTGWVEVYLIFTDKPAAGGNKKTVFFESIRCVREPRNFLATDKEV